MKLKFRKVLSKDSGGSRQQDNKTTRQMIPNDSGCRRPKESGRLRQEVEEVNGIIPLGLDNTSAIGATTCPKPSVRRYIWDIFHRRLTLTRRKQPDFSLQVDWTPGHVDIPGNEVADEAAKRAAQLGSFSGTPKVLKGLPYSKSVLALAHTRLMKMAATKN
jgi:hypothetical protein